MPVNRYDARQLMNRGYEMGAQVLEGTLNLQEDGWFVGSKSLQDWLSSNVEQHVVIVAAPISGESGEKQVCPTCGRRYRGSECPHCLQARRRLRG